MVRMSGGIVIDDLYLGTLDDALVSLPKYSATAWGTSGLSSQMTMARCWMHQEGTGGHLAPADDQHQFGIGMNQWEVAKMLQTHILNVAGCLICC